MYSLNDTFSFARHAVDGSVLWAGASEFNRCRKVVVAPGPILWTACGTRFSNDIAVQRVDSVGRFRSRFTQSIGAITELALAADGGVYMAEFSFNSAGVARLEPGGEVR